MKKQPLRVGFDLDGVLLYNPARIFRPIVVSFKKLFMPQEQTKFHLPKTWLQKLIWAFLHKSSFMIAPGFKELKHLIKENKIEAYIISGRYDSLKGDFNKWLRKIDAERYFTGTYYNSNDKQPHIYKERMIKKLHLDIFIEDNWDIVNHLTNDYEQKTKIFWIYNLLDRNIKYKYKFPNLKKIILYVRRYILQD